MLQFSGKVIHGLKLWRQIGFRTANIKLQAWSITEWTYKINGFFNKKIHSGVGTYLEKKWVFEAHFLDFNDDIYGKKVEITILDILRKNKKFNSLKEIQKQIQSDIKQAKRKKVYVLTFGTFDSVHKWHLYYLSEAKKYWDRLITIVAKDKNVEKFKGTRPLHNEKRRKKDIQETNIPHTVHIGDLKDPLKWIKKYKPQTICLWYDQKGFSSELQKYINANLYPINIVRISPYKEKIFKSSIIKKKKLAK